MATAPAIAMFAQCSILIRLALKRKRLGTNTEPSISQPTLSEHRAFFTPIPQQLTDGIDLPQVADRIKRRPFANRSGQAAPACLRSRIIRQKQHPVPKPHQRPHHPHRQHCHPKPLSRFPPPVPHHRRHQPPTWSPKRHAHHQPSGTK